MNDAPVCLALVLVALATGCVGIEGGNPVAPTIDGSKVTLLALDANTVQVIGESGAVQPASAALRYLELEGTGDFASEGIEGDGSFDFMIDASSLSTFRFRAIEGDLRSAPVDRKASAPGGPLPDQDGCLRYERDLVFMNTGDTRSTTVISECNASVTFLAPRLRFAQDDYLFEDPSTLTLEPGGELMLTVTRNTGTATENILLLESDEQTVAVSLLTR